MAAQQRTTPRAQESIRPITRVALYARVSTLNNQDPEMQLAELREYAGRRGWHIVEEFTDQGVSGCKESRPALNRLMSDACRMLDSPRRGHIRITDRGRTFLGQASERITIKDLEQFPEFQKFRASAKTHKGETTEAEENGQTPEEMLESAYQKFRDGSAKPRAVLWQGQQLC